MEDYFYRGHKITKLGVFWQTQHGETICRSCTRAGIERLIDKLTGCNDEWQNALYHLQRAAFILERNLSDTAANDDENELLVSVRKNIAQFIKVLSK